ncbi:MAG: hypothetical protein LQ346_004710 [Caloplaca aetnensis]|nr:MAG: hypothetical protein LQ346_004710 [Caloplaca aetnensis]
MSEPPAVGLSYILQRLDLAEPEYLLFDPTGSRAWLKETFDGIPRYLFRVTTPKSDGTTDRFWVKSRNAVHERGNYNDDIFRWHHDSAWHHNRTISSMLNSHLQWKPSDTDNFVSWTNSLLFAFQYIFFRCAKDNLNMEDIFLCIIDTTSFPKGVFMKDLDLIQAYSAHDPSLARFGDLRSRKHAVLTGSFYFGEYLSQGALRVDENCSIVSAHDIIEQGLFRLQPEFEISYLAREPKWANEVIRLREPFYGEIAQVPPVTLEELEAALAIAQLFGGRWGLPMAANLLGLRPRGAHDEAVLRAFSRNNFAGLIPPFLHSTVG